MKSFSLVPHNDNSLLLINAGMAPLKTIFYRTGNTTKNKSGKHVRSALEQVISKISEKLQDTVHFLKCLVTSLLVIILKEKQFIGHGEFLTEVVGT